MKIEAEVLSSLIANAGGKQPSPGTSLPDLRQTLRDAIEAKLEAEEKFSEFNAVDAATWALLNVGLKSYQAEYGWTL